MLTAFRRAIETWPVRLLFGLMVIAFVVWGVGDVVRQIGTTTWIAKVGSRTIEPGQFNDVFERDLAQAEQRLPAGQNVTATLRRQVAQAALDQVVAQAAISEEIQRLRLAVPDEAVRQAVFSTPAFQGPDGSFDRARMNAVLANNGLSQDQFLGMVSGQIAQQQMVGALTAGVVPSDLLMRRLFDFAAERRSAQVAPVPFAATATPPTPDAATLQRYYANHPWLYVVPEYRKVRIVVLTAASLAKTITVTPAELQAYYDQHKANFVTPPRRTVQVLVLNTPAAAATLAKKWQAGADWAAMQAAAQAAGGTATELPDTSADDLPDPALAKAAFAASPDTVVGPVATQLGTDVLKVTKVEPGTQQDFAAVKEKIAAAVTADRAANRIYDVANQLDDILGTGAGLTKLPGNLGLIGVSGTLDARGDTPEGKPAPIPGPPELRQAIVTAAFATPPGQPPAQVTEVSTPSAGGSAYYALTVEQVTPATEKPFDQVKDQVTAQWIGAARQKEAERIAARVLTAVQGGESFTAAATGAGLGVHPTELVGREGPDGGMPDTLRRVLFTLKPGQATMVQTGDAFLLAAPAQIVHPEPKQEPQIYAALRTALDRSLDGDVASGFAAALRARAHPRIDHAQFESFVNNGQ